MDNVDAYKYDMWLENEASRLGITKNDVEELINPDIEKLIDHRNDFYSTVIRSSIHEMFSVSIPPEEDGYTSTHS